MRRRHSMAPPFSARVTSEEENTFELDVLQIASSSAAYRWRFVQRGGDVRLAGPALFTIIGMAKAALPYETGGTLVGHYEKDGAVAVVEQALGVRHGAPHSRTHFYRPPDEVDGQLSEIFAATEGRSYYIGEWHTHPDASPSPSKIDLQTLLDLAQSPHVATDTPILFVLGGDIARAPCIGCFLMDAVGRLERAIYLGMRVVGSQPTAREEPGSGQPREDSEARR